LITVLRATILCSTLFLIGCADLSPQLPPAAQKTLRIVSSLPQKGALAQPSKLVVNAIDLAIEQAGHTVGDWSIEHVTLDDSDDETGDWSRSKEAENASVASRDNSVVAYVGPYNSGAAGVSLPITNKAGLLQICPTCTWPGLTATGWDAGEPDVYYPKGTHSFVRLMPSDSQQGAAAAKWAADLGAITVATLMDGSSYSDGLAASFEKAAQGNNLHLVGRLQVKDLGAGVVPKELLPPPDAVFYAPSTIGQAQTVAKGLRSVTLKTGVFASDTALSDQMLPTITDTAEVWHIVRNGDDSGPPISAWKSFRTDFYSAYGIAPSQFAANAYDATRLVIKAIGSVSVPDRASIAKAVLSTQHYQGVTGDITFDEHGDRLGWSMSGYVVRDGRFALDRVLSSAP
jgi:branched-chain amino acid transport system substrate-binding protein